MTDSELILISGGSISSTLLNAISRVISTLYELGKSVGSSAKNIFGRC